INPAIANEFSTAAFRFGHSLIRDKFTRYDAKDDQINSINFTDMVFKSDYAYNSQGQGIQSIVKGIVNDNCKRFGSFGFELQNKLFGKIENNEFTAIDLFATNIQRGRDHALRPYVDYVKLCHGMDVSNFEDLSSLISSDNIQKLKSVYENVADIDLYAGSLMENKVSEKTLAAKTFGCIIMRQFADLKNGDRFYYENGPSVNPSAFTLDQLSQIKKVTMSGLLCNNYEFSSLAPKALMNPSSENVKVSCSALKNQIDFKKWINN
ncbi:Chorion, partial [Brachionus plicatilis]